MSETRCEYWHGNRIGFTEVDGQWYASFIDICLALDLDIDDTMEFFSYNEIPGIVEDDSGLFDEILIDEQGVYQCLFLSKEPSAVGLQQWTTSVLKRLRIHAGLQDWEFFRMTEPETQDKIDAWLDTIFYNEETHKLYVSKTVPGGDVEQVEIENIFVE